MASWDVVVIGGGAAGLTAGAACAEAQLSCLVIDSMGGGGELMNLGELHELEGDLTGPDLAARLLEEAVSAGAELGIAEVTALRRDATQWQVMTTEGEHAAKAVILAPGLGPGTLGLAMEGAYEGRGLSHCAACDGPLYTGQPVVVAGSDRWARQEAADLLATASHVTLVTQGDEGAALSGATVLRGHIASIHGSPGLSHVTVRPTTGETLTIATNVVFIQSGRRPSLDFAPDGLARDGNGCLVIDEANRTSLPGLFAAGDARSGSPRSLAAAMRDGRLAAASVRAALAS